MTRAASEKFSIFEIMHCIKRHAACDWGDLGESDRKANDWAIGSGGRIMSVYKFPDGRVLWVITDGEDDNGIRHATTCLLPEDY